MGIEAYKTSDLCDQLGTEVQVCMAPMTSYGGRRAASGRVACVRTFEDAALIRAQLAQPGEGRILVVDGGASNRVALLGDNMARLGMENGWHGVIIHGAVRDVDALASMNFAVFALSSVPLRGGNSSVGEHGVELRFGGVVFIPGHFVSMDGDGVVVTPMAACVELR